MKRDEFVLVKSEDELRPGMCVELRPSVSGENERLVLLHRAHRETFCPSDGHSGSQWSCRGWVLPDCMEFCPASSIKARRLWRLRDDDTEADETATTRTKRKDRVQ